MAHLNISFSVKVMTNVERSKIKYFVWLTYTLNYRFPPTNFYARLSFEIVDCHVCIDICTRRL